ncbi:MAG TPA: hypothetical protein VF649_06340 [Sphingomonas sp.]|jgi:tetratricopeptide (TPR) repeat protein|uniref:hypothetical protein n=1 Tax=Sphingomonas sp. TaxID=28214 RepID=UPI002EDB2D71
MMRVDRTLLTLGLAAMAAPAIAVPVPSPSPAPLAVDARRVIAEAFGLGQAGDCRGALGKLDPLVTTLLPGAERNSVQLLRMNCLAPAGRGAEVAAVQRELAAADPKNPMVRGFGVMIAADSGDMKAAGEALAQVAEQLPAGLNGITGRLWRAVAQRLSQTREIALRDRISVALARADWQPTDMPQLRSDIAESAIDVLVRRGEVAEAELLLPRVTAPESLFEMAITRSHAPLWPQLADKMGPHSTRAVDAFALDRLAAFAATPDDATARLGAVRALVLLGRYAEASEAASSVRVVEGMDEEAVATVRLDAQALGMTGGRAAAVARLQPFAMLDATRTPVAVSGVIALAETLDEAGRAEEALAAARQALTRGAAALSPWGAGWLKRTEICALSTLGRRAEADAKAVALRAAATDNQAAAIEASLCAKQADAAEPIAVKTLATADGAALIADQFQPDDALWARSGSRLRALWSVFLKRPAVKAAFEKNARILPESLWPLQIERPIPRASSAGDLPTT